MMQSDNNMMHARRVCIRSVRWYVLVRQCAHNDAFQLMYVYMCICKAHEMAWLMKSRQVQTPCRSIFRGSRKALQAQKPRAGRRGYWARRLPSTLRGPVPCFAQVAPLQIHAWNLCEVRFVLWRCVLMYLCFIQMQNERSCLRIMYWNSGNERDRCCRCIPNQRKELNWKPCVHTDWTVLLHINGPHRGCHWSHQGGRSASTDACHVGEMSIRSAIRVLASYCCYRLF